MKYTGKPIVFKATIMWSFHNKINDMAQKYTMDLCNLSDNAVKALEELGINVRKREDKPEKGFHITCKSTIPMKVFDTNGNNLINVSIGNGSTATATVSKYFWKNKTQSGWSPSLVKAVVDNLVEYNSAENVDLSELADEVL
jgi:hypothetical protein